MNVDLRTRYLGLELKHPIVASASPLTGSVDSLQRLQDAGVAAVVLPSLFEEQIEHEEMATHNLMLYGAELSPEAQGFFPEMQHYDTGADTYLKLVADARKNALEVLALPDHHCVLATHQTVLLVCDVRERAYYLKHQQKRADYVDCWRQVANWQEASRRFGRPVDAAA